MGKYFGTDGVRGTANENLDVTLAYKIGLSASYVLIKDINKIDNKKRKPKFIIGKDTRISGSMFESAIAAGICAGGCDVVLCGIVPTPAIAFLVKECGFDAGIMISASHNPAFDNGIKIFNSFGYKLSDELEENIEYAIDNYRDIELKTGEFIGTVIHDEKIIDKYINHVLHVGELNLSELNIKIIIDCANGSASATADKIFLCENQNNIDIINSSPDGLNINKNCGSTHLDELKKIVKSGGYDIGFAFDGDADRCLMIDETGELIDGDRILCVLAEDMKRANKLKNNAIVVTKLSNMGFHKFCEQIIEINVEETDVGDRFVLERMLEKDINLGGEQSGHVIVSDYATTGDGQITAVLILDILKKYNNKKASEIFGIMKSYPQIILNVEIDNDSKQKIMSDRKVLESVEKTRDLLNRNGRVLIRASGTEPLIRIMIEGENQEIITEYAEEIKKVIKCRKIERF